jgi:putative membrane protein
MADQRLSPLSVPYRVVQRGGSVLAFLAFALATGGMSIPLVGLAGPAVLLLLAGTAVALLVVYEAAYYRLFTYELTPDTLDIRSGVLARRTREIPLRRVQNVDISRNVLQRAVGLAAVDFETAGGSETEARLRYVSFDEATRLQRELSRLKRGGDADESAEPSAEVLFALDDGELTLLGALSFDFRLPGAVLLFASGSVPFVTSFLPESFGLSAALVGVVVLVVAAVLVSWIAGATVAVVNYYGFRLVRSGDELQYERGLLQRYSGSIPFDKVQSLTVEDNPLKRWAGYATLLIETAGHGPAGGDNSRGSEAAIPLAKRDRIGSLANEIERVGSPAFVRPPKRTRRRYAGRYLIAFSLVAGALYAANAVIGGVPWYWTAVVLPLIPVAAHYKWKHRGYWLGENHVVTRNGVLKRETKVVPYYRIQTVIDTRTIFQRRLRLATVTVDTAGSLSLGGSDAAAVDIDAETADRLRDELDRRLIAARAARRADRRRRASEAQGGTPRDDRGGGAEAMTDDERDSVTPSETRDDG